MKKKLLSLVLAGAMVASTSVSAFAATGQDVTIIKNSENETGKAEIKIMGEVTGSGGQTVPGTLNVTVPTTASFAITQQGNFNAPEIKVTNNGNQSIDVLAYQFIDVDGADTGINIKGSNQLNDRRDVSLSISGGFAKAYFKSEEQTSTQTGVYSDEGLATHSQGDGVKIAEISGGGNYQDLTLEGKAGTASVDTPARSEFTLKLKIKKTQQAG